MYPFIRRRTVADFGIDERSVALAEGKCRTACERFPAELGPSGYLVGDRASRSPTSPPGGARSAPGRRPSSSHIPSPSAGTHGWATSATCSKSTAPASGRGRSMPATAASRRRSRLRVRCLASSLLSLRQRQPAIFSHAAELLAQRARVVRQAVAPADLLHLDRDLGVAVGGDVGEEVVLDLVAEVAGQHVEELAAGDVGRAEQLAVVPLAAGLLGVSSSLNSSPAGKWPQKMIVNAHRLRTRLAAALPASMSGTRGP